MSHRTPMFLLLAALAASAPASQAQVTLLGRVGSQTTGASVPGADILLLDLDLSARTDQSGRFRFAPVPRNIYRVLVRAVGFGPYVGLLDLSAIDTARATFLLRPVAPISFEPVPLPEVVVRARIPARMLAYEERRSRGVGLFVTRSDLERRENSRLSDILRGLPGLLIVPTSTVEHAVAVRRANGNALQTCYPQVYLDGVRVYDPTAAPAGLGDRPPNVDGFRPRELEGVEVYRGPAETPVEYLGPGARCGTVLLWSRSPTRSEARREPGPPAPDAIPG